MTMINLERGTLKLHAEVQAINPSDSVKAAALTADRFNTPAYLDHAFFNGNSRILAKKHLDSGGAVSVMVPTGPYADESVMVIAHGPESFQCERVNAETIYDYPEDTQQAYWQALAERCL